MSMAKKVFWVGFAILLVLIIFPYVVAYLGMGSSFQFGGFLLNPLDGNSYLAKMEEGRQGSWTFNLLFSPHSSGGSYLFLFYLLLGHLSKWFSLPSILIFHLARILAVVFLLFELRNFLNWVFKDDTNKASLAFIWTIFGGGLGWLLLLFGIRTSDFWVAEAYPFLSSYVNPHFPLALGLMLLSLRLADVESRWQNLLFLFLTALGLAVILPFGVVIVGLILLMNTVWKWIAEKKLHPWQVISFGLGCAPFLIYQFVVVQVNPGLRIWNQQNLTPAPPIWDFLISFLLSILFAIIGIILLIKRKSITKYRTLVVWLIAGGILTYLPFSLQRRFMLGFYIPAVALAVEGIHQLFKVHARAARYSRFSAILSFITPTLIILIGIFGTLSHPAILYLNQNEYKSLTWLKANSSSGQVVLAQPVLSMYVPGNTGLRVVYGHPFETLDASAQETLVKDFFAGKLDPEQEKELLDLNSVQFIVQEGEPIVSQANLQRAGYSHVIQFGDVGIFSKTK